MSQQAEFTMQEIAQMLGQRDLQIAMLEKANAELTAKLAASSNVSDVDEAKKRLEK